ncbi:hypothetical protein [Collinsella tanakaei]|uniref:hypothetical protein n=1 Tax=Collinsella tanakaei TaxID=626935 RepID=UPI001958DF19|nr:hypothetical protein [Collinsella tanakaei]MBM6868968.1 hypothetical protein [Collinsella tanakaei]
MTDERNGLENEDFSPEELRRERTVTLPEFCHALGELIVEACPAFWPVDTLEKDDTVDTIGYNSLAITFGIHPQEIAGKPEGPLGLPEQFGKAGFEHNPESIEHLLNCILNEYQEINARFTVHLRKPGTKESYETGRSSVQLQFLSFFAALWRLKYGKIHSAEVEPRTGYKKGGYDQSKKMLFPCFVLDMLTNQWKGSGDSRLAAYIDGKLDYYSQAAFSSSRLQIAASTYLEEMNSSASINADSTAKTLLTILANSHRQKYQESAYDIEHLISRDSLRTKQGGTYAYKYFKIAGGGLGNLAFLSKSENRSKGSKTLSQNKGELYSLNATREFVDDVSALSDADYHLRDGKSEDAKKFISNRARCMFDRLISILDIS